MIGDRMSYDHPGVNDKGEFVLDNVWLHLPGRYNSDTYFSIRGRRYRKDGSIGKKLIHDIIPFHTEDMRVPRKTLTTDRAD